MYGIRLICLGILFLFLFETFTKTFKNYIVPYAISQNDTTLENNLMCRSIYLKQSERLFDAFKV